MKQFQLDRWVEKVSIRRAAWAYTLLILLLVTLPLNGETQMLGELNNNYVLRIRMDYLFHALLFIPWVVLVWHGWELHWHVKATSAWLILLGGLCFSILTEYIQLLLPYRTFNINDLVANALGVGIGGVLMYVYQRK